MTRPPAPGQVFRYPYLWRREADAGETEGRKRRPVRVAVVAEVGPARTLHFILAITTRPPGPEASLSRCQRSNLGAPVWMPSPLESSSTR
jgi:hypothetical protein